MRWEVYPLRIKGRLRYRLRPVAIGDGTPPSTAALGYPGPPTWRTRWRAQRAADRMNVPEIVEMPGIEVTPDVPISRDAPSAAVVPAEGKP